MKQFLLCFRAYVSCQRKAHRSSAHIQNGKATALFLSVEKSRGEYVVVLCCVNIQHLFPCSAVTICTIELLKRMQLLPHGADERWENTQPWFEMEPKNSLFFVQIVIITSCFPNDIAPIAISNLTSTTKTAHELSNMSLLFSETFNLSSTTPSTTIFDSFPPNDPKRMTAMLKIRSRALLG